MPISLRKTKTMLRLLPLIATLGLAPHGPPREAPQPVLRIRVAQESAPGAGDFDNRIMGFIEPLQTEQNAAAFYGRGYARYNNSQPALTPNKAHVFFVNASDGLAMFVVLGAPNRMPEQKNGNAKTRFELSGGTAQVLLGDDDVGPEAEAKNGGTVFTQRAGWGDSFTDGMVVGALPVGFSILGQFTEMPEGVGAKGMTGWMVISADGKAYPLAFAAGQRVRLDVRLVTDVEQGRP